MSQPVTPATPSAPATAIYGGAAGAAGGAGTGGTGSGSTVLVPNPTPALSALGVGQIIRAVASGRTAEGLALLETRFGLIPLRLAHTPQRGAVLQLRIVQNGNPTLLSVIDPKTENGAARPGATAARPGATTPRAGDIVTVRPMAANSGNAAAAVGASPTLSAQSNVPYQARIVWLSPNPPGTAPSRDGLITGRIQASPPNGPTIVQTPSGALSLPNVGGLRPGLEAALRAIGGQSTTPGAPGSSAASAPLSGGMPTPLTALGSAWTALEDAHAVLTATNAGATNPLAPNAIPATGPQLATGMLFFLNALFHGSVQEWLGREATRVLSESDKQGVLNRLSDDFAQLSRVASEPANGDWRMAILPLLDERKLHQIRLFFRHADGEGDDSGSQEGTRFVVETALSQMGALQLDGLVRPSRFDLMVRTHRELPDAMREDIAQLFANANREFGAAGQIGFRVENPFGVQPGEAGAHAAGVYA